MDIKLNGGVLIIGSLLWDTEDEQRIKWRKDCLYLDNKIPVAAPIRYGRVSTERSCTFSMVFSDECNDTNLKGSGVFIPFSNNPIDLKKLEAQTIELIKSERKKSNLDSDKFNWSWGTLTIAINPYILNDGSPKINEAKLLLSFWSKNYSNGFNPDHYKVGNEEPVLTKQGVLNFTWTDALKNFDFIIATATKPEREIYPNSKNIADRMIASKYSDYFLKNIEYGISTFQDKEILEFMNNKG